MVDDKLRLAAGHQGHLERSRYDGLCAQGHYARDKKASAEYRPADISIRRIADLLDIELRSWVPKETAVK
jgi:hypothetical protein